MNDPDAGACKRDDTGAHTTPHAAGDALPPADTAREVYLHAPEAEPRPATRPPLLVVLGATATGKTALSLALAHALGGEIVNADSRYFYRGMDIGTAKPTPAERGDIPHHLIDTRRPLQGYSLAEFLDDARAVIADLHARGTLPIVTGGTPQYLRALLEGWTVPTVPPNPELRAQLEQEPVAELHERLVALDPGSAARTGPHNKRRIIRALEVTITAGQPMSALTQAQPPTWDALELGLRMEREPLYARIDARVQAMHSAGWPDEVAALAAEGVTAETPAMSAHGYREALAMLAGTMTQTEAIASTCFLIHKYVRHQETWFRRFADVHWLDAAAPDVAMQALALTRDWLAARST